MLQRLKNIIELSKYAPKSSDVLDHELILEQNVFPKKKFRPATIIEDKPLDIFQDDSTDK